MKTLEVKDGANLAAILKSFPAATVTTLPGPSGDRWRLDVPEESDIGGPARVVVEVQDGQVVHATTPGKAAEDHGIRPDVVFVRRDGWTLGATMGHREAALEMWRDEWSAEINLATGFVTPIFPDSLEVVKVRKTKRPIRKVSR